MANGAEVLADIFQRSRFQVPQFQRAYAWEASNLEDFLADLQNHPKDTGRRYFFGTILLTKRGESGGYSEYDIVDGQQRLTTAVIFATVCIQKLGDIGHERAAHHDAIFRQMSDGRSRFRTIQEDREFFARFIVGDDVASESQCNTPSQKRLLRAKRFFAEKLSSCSTREILGLLDVLAQCQLLDYVVETDAEATLIFELQNDRGRRLTNLEALKSFLMHGLYLYAGPHTDDDLSTVQSNFAELYRAAESIESRIDAPSEDQVLSFHLIAFEEWVRIDDNEGWYAPKQLVKNLLDQAGPDRKREWIRGFSRRICDSFKSMRLILDERDQHQIPALGDLTVLGRTATYWPLILKLWHSDKSVGRTSFHSSMRHLERFAFRSAVAGKRADAGEARLRRAAQEFSGNFPAVNKLLEEMRTWWEMDRYFAVRIDSPSFYQDTRLARYVLWRYENALRAQTGRQTTPIHWDAILDPPSKAVSFAVDHIEPKDESNPNLQVPVIWNPNDDAEPFVKVALHRLGNLVLDQTSGNSRKGNKGFQHREVPYTSGSTFLSQGEIVTRFATKLVTDGIETKIWDADAVRTRHQILIKFASNL